MQYPETTATDTPLWQQADLAVRRGMAGDPEWERDYRQALVPSVGKGIPIFMHLKMLRERGHGALAATAERLALTMGADLSMASLWPKTRPETAIAEYRALFARGLVNSRMVSNYAKALSHAGEAGTLGNLVAGERLLRIEQLDATADDGRPLHRAVADALLALRDTGHWHEERQSVRRMDFLSLDFNPLPPLLGRLLGLLREHAERFLDDLRGAGHLLSDHLPQSFEMAPWALFSDGGGYNVPHIHHRSWITGVYYVACDPSAGDDGAGTLLIGPPEGADATCPGWLHTTIRPEPGRLALFPSFYTHRTAPLGRPGLRISLPFDMMTASP